MNKYQIEIVETLSRVIDIEANSYEDALEKVKEKYDNCIIKHFSLYDGEIVNRYQKPVDDHGQSALRN